MKLILTITFLFVSQILFAQADKNLIYNTWVKTKLQYQNGDELLDEQGIKYTYIRYSFEKPNKAFISFNFNNKGTYFTFDLRNNLLELKNSYGIVTSILLIEELTPDILILQQKGENGFGAPDNFRYYFISERSYQKSTAIKPNDILSINGTDTTFISSEKMYAKYKGNITFHDFLTANMPEHKYEASNYFLASFIVRKTGEVDSLQILESINPNFDQQFIKAFNKAKKNWQPAVYNGRPVNVQMKEQFKFIPPGKFLPAYDYSKKGKEAMAARKYSSALYYFEKALESTPDDSDLLYYKANCNIQLGNIDSACADLQKLKAAGIKMVDPLIEKNCH